MTEQDKADIALLLKNDTEFRATIVNEVVAALPLYDGTVIVE